jgi:hypothetical protein
MSCTRNSVLSSFILFFVGQSDLEEMAQVSSKSSVSPPPDDDFTGPDLGKESRYAAIAGNLEELTASHKPITSDDIGISDETAVCKEHREADGICGDGIVSVAPR